MGEAAHVSSILELLETITGEEAKPRGRLVPAVGKEVKSLITILKVIQPVCDDAEKMKMANSRNIILQSDYRLTDAAYEMEDASDEWNSLQIDGDGGLKNYTDELTDAAYDIEDVLDGWNTFLLKLQVDGVGKTSSLKAKVRSCVNQCLHPVQIKRFDHPIAARIEDINSRLHRLEDYYRSEVREIRNWRTPLYVQVGVPVAEIVCRDMVKEDIVSNLLHRSSYQSELEIISIVGMFGVGKTAVAELVKNDYRVLQHFDILIWLHVSHIFDKKNVALAFIESLGGFGNKDEDLDLLLERICRSVEGKTFFLVLDDVWEDNMQEWERLIQTFKHGAAGSRILLTTRKQTVANMMKNMMEYSHVFFLENLDDGGCCMIAFAGTDQKECMNLEDIQKEISKKSKGLPLAAKILGNNLDRRERQIFLSREAYWQLDMQGKIFVSLSGSYYDLPSPVKRCFRHCAIFPKDFVYNREYIIYHWMAQGLLGLNGDQDLELKGSEYIDLLAACSLFEVYEMDLDGRISKWKMHDFVHDFAQFLMRKEIVIEEVNSGRNLRMSFFPPAEPRYLTVLIAQGNCLPNSMPCVEKLRGLLTVSGVDAITDEAMRGIFNQAKLLRLLDFGCPDAIKDTIPKEIGNLIHLRHINLSGNGKIKELPESVCELYNLQYLNLDNCISLEKLPDGIGKLINLGYLGTNNCYRLSCYPKSARKLTNLRRLRGIVLRADRNDPEEFSLGDLKNLNKLCELSIVLKGNAVNDRELRRACFENKMHLKEIKLQ